MKKIYSLLIAFACASFMMANATTYTVVGGSDAIFGTSWSPENAANDMVADGDVFKLVKEGIELPVGDIEYKIVEEHSWAKSYPQSGNAKFNIAKSGKYDITFVLDLAKSPEYSAVAELKEEVVIDPTVSLKGSWDSWAAEVKFQLAADKKSAVAKKELDPATYEFKAIINGSDWRSNGGSINRENPKADGIDGNNDANMKLVADAKGEYAFTWIFDSNSLEVEFPEKGDDPIVPPVVDEAFFLKNNWNGGEAWTWEAMSKDEADGLWKLEHVFGGTGVNLNTKAEEEGAEWFPLEKIAGDEIQALDTVRFIYDSKEKVLSAVLLGRPAGGEDPIVPPVVDEAFFLKNNWNGGEAWTWEAMSKDEADGLWKLEHVFGGTGVNLNSKAEEEGAEWFPLEKIAGDEIQALDTVRFIYDSKEKVLSAVLLGRPSGTPEPPVVDEAFFLKNNWNGGEAWTWEAMSKDEADGLWKLEHVFGGTGVNLNSKAEEEGAEWFPLDKIAGDEIQALDTVRFIYDSKEKVLSAVLLGRHGDAPQPPVLDPTVVVFGTMTDPAWTVLVPFTLSEDQLVASLSVENVQAGEYEFKLIVNGDYRSNGYRYHRDYPGAVIKGNNEANMIFEADKTGAYSFFWFFANDSLSIIYPEKGDTPEPPVVDEAFFLKNNWNGGEAWTWEAMSKDEADGLWKLEHVFGGTGVNLNTKAEEEGAEWFPLEKIAGDEIQALDTVRFIYDSKEKVLSAVLLGRPAGGEDPIVPPVVDEAFFLKNNWNGGEAWTWEAMSKDEADGLWKLEHVFGGTGVNLNSKAEEEGAEWFPLEKIAGDEIQALDTVRFIYDSKEKVLSAMLIGRPSGTPEPPVSEDGIFIIGTFNNWTPSAEYALLPNLSLPEGVEYMVSGTLQAGDELKVLVIRGGQKIYFPEGDNIVVTPEYAGKCTLYFRPDGNIEWPWFYIYIHVEQEQGLNTINASDKAVKMIQNGQLFIQKNGKTYNVLGTLVK